MKNLIEQFAEYNFLVTLSGWFYAPDGRQYHGVWGRVAIKKDDETLGIKTNNQSTNWYAVIGEGEKSVIVAGCQIKYACVCINPPHTGNVKIRVHSEQHLTVADVEREGQIYLAQ